MSIYSEYKRSLKIIEVEEFFDLFFYRPLAFLVVKALYYTSLTPNQVTFIAVIFGIIGSVLMGMGVEWFIPAAVCFVLFDVFDCSDGMLARLKGNGTRFGRVVDGFGDYTTSTAMYLGIGVSFACNSDNPLLWWGLLLLCAMSEMAQSVALDYYRTRYLDIIKNQNNTNYDDEMLELIDEFEKLKKQKGQLLTKMIIYAYINYYKLQLKFAKNKSTKAAVPPVKYDIEDFRTKNSSIIRFWTLIGPTTHITLLIVCLLIQRLDLYIIALSTVWNFILLVLLLIQKIIDKKVKQIQTEN